MSRWARYVLGVVFVVILCSVPLVAGARGTYARAGLDGVSPRSGDDILSRVDRILAAGNPSAIGSFETGVDQTKNAPDGNPAKTAAPVIQASVRSEAKRSDDDALAGTVSGSPGKRLLRAHFSPSPSPQEASINSVKSSKPPLSPSLLEREQMKDILMPEAHLRSVGNLPTALPDKLERNSHRLLQIVVSHSSHVFKLLRIEPSGQAEVLHECRVGLGDPASFPTPVGTYFVTHIYDRDPWWIPPPNRAWAAGQSPSKRVYGGTMAPLLKKRSVRSRRRHRSIAEDEIEGAVRLEDYGYRFHGTNSPRSIGRNQSHGCVRMLPADAKKVAMLIEENVGIKDRKEAANGSFVILKAPVRLNLIK